MCARYAYFTGQELGQFMKRFDVDRSAAIKKLEARYNISPGTINPTITRNSPNRLTFMKWGLVPFWAKDPSIGNKMINARAESIETKPSFRKPIRNQRCLVPASGFYEWKTLKLETKPEKIPWYLGIKNEATFSLAGIYDIWRDAEKMEYRTYSIITTEPNALVSRIHNRMPVILAQKDENQWLDQKTPLEKILKLLQPFPANKMVSWPVSRRINKPLNDDPDLIKQKIPKFPS